MKGNVSGATLHIAFLNSPLRYFCRQPYANCHAELIRAFDKIHNRLGVTRMKQQGVRAALADRHHLHQVVAQIGAARRTISEIARRNGLQPIPTATNFVSIDCGRDGSHAGRVLDGLLSRGIFARMPGVAPLDRAIRITAGTNVDLALLAGEPQVLKAVEG
ncbi:MAG: hypothetical protein HYX36_07420 [Rhizobiales bacterium]|nr:hypothetical protein [Hyphomicrobiales bacterium]